MAFVIRLKVDYPSGDYLYIPDGADDDVLAVFDVAKAHKFVAREKADAYKRTLNGYWRAHSEVCEVPS